MPTGSDFRGSLLGLLDDSMTSELMNYASEWLCTRSPILITVDHDPCDDSNVTALAGHSGQVPDSTRKPRCIYGRLKAEGVSHLFCSGCLVELHTV
jgi:hypothetical protein